MSHRPDLFYVQLKSQYFKTHMLLCYSNTFDSLSSRIAKDSNSYRDVGFQIF